MDEFLDQLRGVNHVLKIDLRPEHHQSKSKPKDISEYAFRTMYGRAKHLRITLEILRKRKLSVKFSKGEF